MSYAASNTIVGSHELLIVRMFAIGCSILHVAELVILKRTQRKQNGFMRDSRIDKMLTLLFCGRSVEVAI